ncbi:MAG: hypothetical protein JXA41_06215 [Deltaproteobacteria bacterium]|nr:hypothetical protein [Deltaproteobacteria bacterium]
MQEKLIAMMDRYLECLVANDPSTLPIAKNLKITENGYPVQLGQGLLETASEITYRHYIPDAPTGQIVLYGVARETMKLANFLVRLKVESDVITEIETIIAREGTASIANPASMKEPKPIYSTILDPSERTPREEMIAAAESYFNCIEDNTANVPFHRECNRTANGQQTTNSGPVPLSCLGQFEKKIFAYITKVRNRRYVIVEEQKGLVFGVFMMDVPARKEHFDLFPIPMEHLPVHMITPHTIYLAELFKIVKGQIRQIEALMFNTTLGAHSGWPDMK